MGDDGEVNQFPVEHAYSHKAEVEKYARTKDVGRHFVQEYDEFTTVLITYATPSGNAGDHYPERITRRRRRALKRAGVWEEYAGVSLLAPSKPSAPTPDTYTHAHDALWMPGHISSNTFDSLREVDGFDVHVSVEHQISEEVETPAAVNRRDLDADRGATTALPHEVGANLPVLTAIKALREGREKRDRLDASNCPPYVELWCAQMSCGSDGTPTTNGMARWRQLGRFSEIGDSVKESRGYEEMGCGALTETEHAFVEQYVEEVGDLSADRICDLLEENIDEFDDRPDPQTVVSVIRERL
ncbi:hypothetical protein U4E84_02725 [Halorubrum sp. AD140]|uniref:hypothetical protein n=1 Tax=Halorubrum sp. AD140 TaxID=3050073 RepID=UPI002ACCE5AF|nr:hypothetical protein [Halorubrum sp. AD140]MDZ5810270.1 hypothetical protein [Halorubrum sp. AD140]